MDEQTDVVLNTGRKMPLLGLGTYQLKDETAKTVEAALRMGYRMVDTSGDYGTQKDIGRGLKQSGLERKSYFISTKIEENDDAYEAVQMNLQELDLDYVDLVLIHRPPPSGVGENLWHGLIQAKLDNMTKDIGLSNYDTGQIQDLIDATGHAPAVNQIEWSPFGHSRPMLDYCRDKEIIIQSYSPLTRGKRLKDPFLKHLARRYGKTPAQIMLRWNIEHGVVPLPKANQLEHLEENLDVFDFGLTTDEIANLDELNEYYSVWSALPYVGRLTSLVG